MNNENKSAPITNPKLREAMKNLRNGGEKEFVKELLQARLLCPAKIEGMMPAPGQIKPGEKMNFQGRLQLFVLNTKDGKSFLMAFTDTEELQKWRKEDKEQVVIWGLPQYAGILGKEDCPHEGFVINPFSENIIVHKEFLKKIQENVRPIQKPFVFGGPAPEPELMEDDGTFPEGLIPAMREYMEQSGDVLKAYLLEMTKEEEQDYLLVVETTENPRYLFPCITNACEPFLGEKKMNIVPAGTELAKAVTEGRKPVFVMKKKR